ncbi:hypothetical protein BKN14_00425 [Candidatus Gracilibacteria bacterium HOT-871]|nr:hypothetical protein BKN14_00425 [Candidatus Gracilibacteria bacterium HOT-871]
MGNKNLFPLIVGKARIRNYEDNGEFFDVACATNVKTTFSTSETKELVCGGGDSLTLEKPTGSITLKVIKTKNPELLGKILNLDVTSKVAGANTITDQKVIFDKNGIIEMLERSNDNLGITSIVVKSKDGATTYVKDTDYTVKVVKNRTIIERKGTNIPEQGTVLVSGTINQNAYKEVTIKRVQRGKKKFMIELFGENEENGKMTLLQASPVELDAEYILEMVDAFRDGDIAGSELSFKLSDGGSITFKDENI